MSLRELVSSEIVARVKDFPFNGILTFFLQLDIVQNAQFVLNSIVLTYCKKNIMYALLLELIWRENAIRFKTRNYISVEEFCEDNSRTGTLINIGGFRGGGRGRPPTARNFLNFMQFFRKSDNFECWPPLPGRLALPPTGNPGSAPD